MTLTLKMGSSVHLPQHGHVLFIIGNSFGPTMGYMGAQSSKMWQNLVFNKDLSYFGNVFFQKITLEFSEGKFFIKIHDLYSAESSTQYLSGASKKEEKMYIGFVMKIYTIS